MNYHATFDQIPIADPSLPPMAEFVDLLRSSYESGPRTLGNLLACFEKETSLLTGVRHAIAVSSCTSGLMLAFSAMGFSEGSEIVLPSFTFAATVQALLWNRLIPVYVDCLPETMTIDPDEVRKAITKKTAAVCPVNIFGLPPDIDELEYLAGKSGIPLIFDSAQGLGATYKNEPCGGFGLCEVFSLSPTKPITAIEGGIVTTNDGELNEKIRGMRDYGKGPIGNEMYYYGLSARMSEMHAAVGLLNLRNLDCLLEVRMKLVQNYRERLGCLPGCRVQHFSRDRKSTGNYFTLLIGPEAKCSVDKVAETLKIEGIQSKRYFHPPVHLQKFFRETPHRVEGNLTNTMYASASSLALPLYSHMSNRIQDRVCNAVESLLA